MDHDVTVTCRCGKWVPTVWQERLRIVSACGQCQVVIILISCIAIDSVSQADEKKGRTRVNNYQNSIIFVIYWG